jgi:UDP-N-acetylglucosamine--N-acetylmuramyl-(pentapeptide) pyrophosphoryl-undecaprenol N-acetylglucosamine transferase
MALDHMVLAGGGSGGHVFPALAVVVEMQKRGWNVSWLGREMGMERSIVEDAGLTFMGLEAKAVVGRNLVQRARALTSLAGSAAKARVLIRRLDTRVVLGTGGYVSAPGVMGAALARCPIVLLEPNAVPGAANRWLSRWARTAAVADREGVAELRCEIVETGVPVRREFFDIEVQPERGDKTTLLVLGGSQGARRLNELLPVALESQSTKSRLKVVHQVGETLVAEARAAYEARRLDDVDVEIVPFIQDMHRALANADLVISRAGAITLAEICAIGRAALLLPLDLAGSHQVANARRLVDLGGAEMMLSKKLDADSLSDTLETLLSNRQGLVRMGETNHRLAKPEAASRVADLLEQAAGAR